MVDLKPASDLLAGGVVRILKPDCHPVGAGVLVDSSHVVTCAHVAAYAAGVAETSQDPPTATIMLDFPALGKHQPLRAHVLKEGWRPVDAEQGGDIAVIQLDDPLPPGAAPPPLLRPPVTRERKVLAEGFPAGYPGEITSENVVVAEAGPRREWLQLAPDGRNGFLIEEGYSGTPLWDPDAEAVLGIAMGKDKAERGAFMIPVRVLAEAWPALEESIGWRLRFDPDAATHWGPRGRGVTTSSEEASLFTGRERILRDLVGWVENPDGRARLIRGVTGSGKSAVLSRLVLLADRELRQATVIDDAPDGTVPPVGAVDLAIVVADKTLDQVVATMSHWLDVNADTAASFVNGLGRRPDGRPPLIVVDQLDAARDPEALVTFLLQPLAKARSARLLVGVKRRDDCPLAAALSAYADQLGVDDEYWEEEDVERYVRRLLTDRSRGYAADKLTTERVAAGVTRAASRSYVVAQLSAMSLWQRPDVVKDPPQGYPTEVISALSESLDALSVTVEPVAARRPALKRKLRDLLAALAYAKGPGLPTSGPSWPAVAEALHARSYKPEDVAWLLDTPAIYLLQKVDLEGETGQQLFHEALGASLRDEFDDDAVHTAIVERLGALCEPTNAVPAARYVARHLPGHVAEIQAWETVAAQPHILDRLDPQAVCGEALRSGPQGGLLPAAIAGVIRSNRLMERSDLGDRAGLRQLGMARGRERRSFSPSDSAVALSAWTIRSAVVREDNAHLTLDAPAAVHAVATFSGPGGLPLIAAGCGDGSVRLWSGATGESFGDSLLANTGREDSVRAIAACHAGSRIRLVVAMRDGTVRIWDPLRGGDATSFPAARPGEMRSITAFISQGDLRIVTGGEDDGLQVWDEAGERLGTLAAAGSVRALTAQTSDGRVCLIAGSDDGRVRVWEDVVEILAVGTNGEAVAPTRQLVGPVEWVRGVCAFEGTGGMWVGASGDESRLTLWRSDKPEPEHRPETREQRAVLGVTTYDDAGAPRVASCGAPASLELWDPSSASHVGQPLTGHRGYARAIAAYEIGGEPFLVTGGEDKTVRVWNPASAIGPLASGRERHDGPVHAVDAFHGVVVTGGADGFVRAWDPSTGEPVAQPLEAGVGTVHLLLAGPHGGVAVGGEETVRFLHPLTGAELAEPLVGHVAPVRTCLRDLRVDGESALATGSEDGTVRLWRLADGAEIAGARSRHSGAVRALVLLEVPGAGTCIAVLGYDRAFTLRRASGGTVGLSFIGHTDWPMAGCSYQAPAVPRLVTAGDDHTVRNWNPLTREPLSLRGRHDGAIHALAALTQGRNVRICSGGEDETVRVWDPSRPLGSQQTHRLELGVRVNALSVLGDAVLVGTDEGHLVVTLD
jgi:WD40 repeat protein